VQNLHCRIGKKFAYVFEAPWDEGDEPERREAEAIGRMGYGVGPPGANGRALAEGVADERGLVSDQADMANRSLSPMEAGHAVAALSKLRTNPSTSAVELPLASGRVMAVSAMPAAPGVGADELAVRMRTLWNQRLNGLTVTREPNR
jgi:hypothetical protein